MDQLMITLGTVSLVAAAGAFIVFVVLYAVLANWRATPMGRHLMTFMGLFAAIILYVVIVTFFRINPARAYVRFGIWTSVAIVGWWRVGLLLWAQGVFRRCKRPEDKKDSEPKLGE